MNVANLTLSNVNMFQTFYYIFLVFQFLGRKFEEIFWRNRKSSLFDGRSVRFQTSPRGFRIRYEMIQHLTKKLLI